MKKFEKRVVTHYRSYTKKYSSIILSVRNSIDFITIPFCNEVIKESINHFTFHVLGLSVLYCKRNDR